MAPCDVLRIWDEQHPPLGYVVPSGEMRVCETPVALTIHGKDFPDVPSLEWLADAVKEKLERDGEITNAEIIKTVQLWWDTIKNDTWVDYDMRQKHEKVLERLKELLKV